MTCFFRIRRSQVGAGERKRILWSVKYSVEYEEIKPGSGGVGDTESYRIVIALGTSR